MALARKMKKTKNTLLADWFRIGIDIDFDNLNNYCLFTEKALKKEQVQFKKTYKKAIEQLSEAEMNDFENWSIDEHWHLHDVFPAFQWNSLFSTAYNLFDKNLNAICINLEKPSSVKIELQDLKDTGIKRAKVFLTKVVGIDSVFACELWEKIIQYSKLRNVLVHTSGDLDRKKNNHKYVIDSFSTHSSVIIKPIIPNSDFIKIGLMSGIVYESISDYKAFLNRLCKMEKPVES